MLGLRPWLWLACILGAAAVVGGAYWTGRVHEKNAQAAVILESNQRAQRAEQALVAKTREIDLDDQVKSAALNQRLIVQLSEPRPIWVCNAGERETENPPAAGERDAARDGRHVLPPRSDLSAPLLVYGRDCERIRQKLTALQEWAASVTQPGSAEF